MKDKCCIFCTLNEDETYKAGKILASLVKGIVRLEGDLGTGKTVFARGVANGLGIDDYITSPTFNIVNVYEKDGIVFNHMDAYRITDPEMLYDIGFDEIADEGYITIIEWADMIKEALDDRGFRVKLDYSEEAGKRIITMEGTEDIIEGFCRRWK